ncbi:MAG: amidase [Alphaproteobacteria bacterium]
MAGELWRLGAGETAAAVRDGEASAVDVTEAHLDRLQQVNPAINAVTVTLADEALAAAKAVDKARAAGEPLGPLAGVPVTIKENTDQAGQATTNGLPALANHMALEDAPSVANLRKAGAVIIGRTNTPEFSVRWHTDNPLRGATRNPWDPSRVAGGSSGGAAAAVAAGIGAVAHGNDAGGSLRYPAYCCGVATIKPTLGRVPHANPSAWEERPPGIQLMSVQGPIARKVADVRLAFEAMAAGDPRDSWWVPAPLQGPKPEGPVKVAMTVDPAGGGVDDAVAAAVRQAGTALAEVGYEVEEVEPPLVKDCASLWALLQLNEIRWFMGPAARSIGSDAFNAVLDAYEAFTPTLEVEGYARALADRARLLRAWMMFFQAYPLVLGPVSCTPPMKAGLDTEGPDAVAGIIHAHRLLIAVNTLGLPAAAVPTGLVGGVPLGVQVIGARYREDMCLDAAAAIEAAGGLPTPIDPVP